MSAIHTLTQRLLPHRWGCSIDLKRNVLKFGNLEDLELPFLAEHELPESARISFGPAGQEGPPGMHLYRDQMQ